MPVGSGAFLSPDPEVFGHAPPLLRSGGLVGYSCRSGSPGSWAESRKMVESYGCDFLFDDDVSGLAVIRPGFAAALERVEPGMVLVVPGLEHLCWRVDELAALLVILAGRGVALVSLTEEFDSRDFPKLSDFAQLLIRFQGAVVDARNNPVRRAEVSKRRVSNSDSAVIELVIEGSMLASKASEVLGLSVAMVYRKVRDHLLLSGKSGLRASRSVTSHPEWPGVLAAYCDGTLSGAESADLLGVSYSRFRYAVKTNSG